jgi:hypothetical protein
MNDQATEEQTTDHLERIEWYRAYKAARVDRFRARAAHAIDASNAAYKRSSDLASFIPMGQPILVGHHSEKRHRRDLERIHRAMDRSCQEARKAKYWERRAQAAESNGAISSRDPEAITLLRAKLVRLEARHAEMKAVNAAHKAYLKKPALLDAIDLPENVKEKIRAYKPAYSWHPHPFTGFPLTNSSANLKRVRERIHQLSERQGMPARVVADRAAGITVEALPAEGMIRVFFLEKPDADTRTRLKRNGFRWAPSQGAWTAHYARHRETFAIDLAAAAAPDPEDPTTGS